MRKSNGSGLFSGSTEKSDGASLNNETGELFATKFAECRIKFIDGFHDEVMRLLKEVEEATTNRKGSRHAQDTEGKLHFAINNYCTALGVSLARFTVGYAFIPKLLKIENEHTIFLDNDNWNKIKTATHVLSQQLREAAFDKGLNKYGEFLSQFNSEQKIQIPGKR